ncbi:MAG TPA: serine/threonine-protein kinase, partial [Lautropia sp.]|nr:serine/threonine-protein kinase [Lautropia sp.]
MSDPDATFPANMSESRLPRSEHGMMMTLPPGSLLPDGALRSPETSLPIGTRLGEFEISGVIGEGGFGIVYMATDHLLGRQVALKEYMPSSLATRGSRAQVGVKSERHAETFEAGRRSFINEARLLAQFDHPALVKVFRFWEANGTAYMVMPYYRGRTLRQALEDMGSPPSQAWLQQLLLPLVEALGTLHAARCYHRDIAPDNILLLDNGRPVLLDFGAARRVIGDITQALTVILKPGFAPVEQYANGPEMKQGPWTDVYALAAVIYYCATLKTPVPSVSRMMKDTLQPFSELAGDHYDEQFCAAVDNGLAVAVDERIQDMAQFREALGLDALAGRERAQIPPTGHFNSRQLGSERIAETVGAGNGDLEPTILDPSAFDRTGGTRSPLRSGADAVSSYNQPPRLLNEEKAMTARAPESKERNEKPWTPNADVQMERVAVRSQAEEPSGGTPWLPIAAAVLLIAAGAGGYWFW